MFLLKKTHCQMSGNWKIALPPSGGISVNVSWGKKYEKGKRKRWQMLKKKEEQGKKG
jgi:hypothetical protein